MLKLNTNLKVLFLRWNNISEKGGKKLSMALQSNVFIRIFDISFNALGTNDESVKKLFGDKEFPKMY
jgi:hypothetical protein